ncbi:hypothetical protein SBV1_560013 [Verrucomicrobia bacterium]|nr:hypothetical protein SBV1_560013 [Verrucomicrobiota bacterium]
MAGDIEVADEKPPALNGLLVESARFIIKADGHYAKCAEYRHAWQIRVRLQKRFCVSPDTIPVATLVR